MRVIDPVVIMKGIISKIHHRIVCGRPALAQDDWLNGAGRGFRFAETVTKNIGFRVVLNSNDHDK